MRDVPIAFLTQEIQRDLGAVRLGMPVLLNIPTILALGR